MRSPAQTHVVCDSTRSLGVPSASSAQFAVFRPRTPLHGYEQSRTSADPRHFGTETDFFKHPKLQHQHLAADKVGHLSQISSSRRPSQTHNSLIHCLTTSLTPIPTQFDL